ncbi:MAG TPA: hypothetical protein VKE51_37270 [Vicinamibacterales bacterium]|nr:hypothetical protein [Vicinamibacterales bacterium]
MAAPPSLWLLPLINGGRPSALAEDTPFVRMQGQLSADEQWLAYASNETGRFEIYVRSIMVEAKHLSPYHAYAVTRDGERFPIPRQAAGANKTSAAVIVNWAAGLPKWSRIRLRSAPAARLKPSRYARRSVSSCLRVFVAAPGDPAGY